MLFGFCQFVTFLCLTQSFLVPSEGTQTSKEESAQTAFFWSSGLFEMQLKNSNLILDAATKENNAPWVKWMNDFESVINDIQLQTWSVLLFTR